MRNRIRWYPSFLIGLALLLSIVIAACGQPALSLPSPMPNLAPLLHTAESPPPEQSPPVDEAANGEEWNTVNTFTGKGNETTPPFHISGVKWRITWTADAEYAEYAVFELLVYTEGTYGILTKRISHSGDSASDTTYIYDGEGDYYIKVVAANLRSWTIIVEDYGTEPHLSPVQITRIRYKGTFYPRDSENCICYERIEPDEYVEIKNLGDAKQDIGGWLLKNITKGYPSFTFPPYTLAPGEGVVVYTDELHWTPQQLRSQWRSYVQEKYDNSCDRGYPCMSIPFPSEPGGFSFCYGLGDIWNNEEPDVVALYNPEGEEVSRKSYTIPTD